MNNTNVLIGNDIYNTALGRREHIGTVNSGNGEQAVDLINRADRAQASRKYTKAARLSYQAEQIADITWKIDE